MTDLPVVVHRVVGARVVTAAEVVTGAALIETAEAVSVNAIAIDVTADKFNNQPVFQQKTGFIFFMLKSTP